MLLLLPPQEATPAKRPRVEPRGDGWASDSDDDWIEGQSGGARWQS